MPEKRIFVPPSVLVQLAIAVLVAVVGLLATLAGSAALDWRVWGSALMLLASRASQVYFQASKGWQHVPALPKPEAVQGACPHACCAPVPYWRGPPPAVGSPLHRHAIHRPRRPPASATRLSAR